MSFDLATGALDRGRKEGYRGCGGTCEHSPSCCLARSFWPGRRLPAAAQQPQTVAGRIKVASGSAFIVRAGAALPAQAGQLVFEADALQNRRRRPARRHAEGRHARLARPGQRNAAGPVRLRPGRGPAGPRAQGRPRRGGLRLGTNRQALARLDPARNAGGDRGRPRNDAGDPRRA